jgi:putative ABC transport system permease protein
MAGRGFTGEDTRESPGVAVVNEAFVRAYWPDEDPIGRRIHPETDPGRLYPGYESTVDQLVTVVGVVQDFGATFYGDPPRPELYLSQDQHPYSRMFLVARGEGDPLALVPLIRQGLARVDDAVPVTHFRTGESMVGDWLQESRGIGAMLGVLAVLALGMALIGLYGMVSHSVAQRTFELGVRMVLGARKGAIQASVMRSFMILAAVGLTVGVVVGLALGMVMRSFLVLLQVPWIPMTLGISGLMMGVVAVAAWLPARRATSIQPVVALKCE